MRPIVIPVVMFGLLASAVGEPAPSLVLAAPGTATGQLRTEATPHDLYASYQIHDAFTHEIREELASGLPVEFIHFIEVARKRTFWFDRILVRRTLKTRAVYDTLTRQYTLTRQVDGETAQTAMALSEDEMVRWMTSFDRMRLADPAAVAPGAEGSLYVRVKSRLRRRFLLLFIPWDVETAWERSGLPPQMGSSGRGR